MITYYEMIEYIEKLKTAPRNDKNITYFINHKIHMPGNVLYRFIDHITDLTRTRLNNSLDNFIDKIKIVGKDENTFSLEILEIKKEIDYLINITKAINIPEENKNKLKETIHEFSTEVKQVLENNANRIDTTGRLLKIIRDYKLDILEE